MSCPMRKLRPSSTPSSISDEMTTKQEIYEWIDGQLTVMEGYMKPFAAYLNVNVIFPLFGPIDPKEHMWYILTGCVIVGSILGLLVGLLLTWLRQWFFRPNEEEEFIEERERDGEEAEPLLPDDEEDDDAVSYKLLRGKFNSGVINNLRRWNKNNGELVQLQEEEKEESEEESDETAESGVEDGDEGPDEDEEERDDNKKNDENEKPVKEKKKKKLEYDPAVATAGEQEMMKKLGTLHGKLATAKLRQESIRMKKQMSAKEREEEAKIRAQQLESILQLMKAEQDKFGVDSESQVLDQMNQLYNI